MKNVLFVVEASNRLGMGHVSRCLEISRLLRNKKINSHFLINRNNKIIELLSQKKTQFSILSEHQTIFSNIRTICIKKKISCIIIDLRKKLSKEFFMKLREISKTVIIVNNTSKNIFNSDLIIFPEIKEQYPSKLLKNKSKNILIGAKYAILNNNYEQKTIQKKDSILISMGGSDKRNITEKLITEFKKSDCNFKVNVVIGKFFSNPKKIIAKVSNDKRFTIIKDVNNLIPLMHNAKIGIFMFGITTYEALSVGLPAIVMTHSKENDIAAKKLLPYDCIYYLGYFNSVNVKKIPSITFSLLKNSKTLKKMGKNGKKIVDGKGSLRVTNNIIKLIKSKNHIH